MKHGSAVTVPAVLAACVFLLSAACGMNGRGTAGGGNSTAAFYNDLEIVFMKAEACAGGPILPGVSIPGNTLPILDGLKAVMAGDLRYFVADLAATGSCGEFLFVLNGATEPESCAEPSRKCSGRKIQACVAGPDGNAAITFDCGAIGLDCLDGNCVLGTCVTSACDGDTLVVCDEMNLEHRYRCGSVGLGCGYGDESFQCAGRGEQCSTTDLTPFCSGSILTWCLGGRIAELDCAAITDGRRTCSQSWIDSNPEASSRDILEKYLDKVCARAYSECEDGISACDGSAAVFCRDGLFEGFDCRDSGFSTCTPPGGDVQTATCSGLPATR